jgi:ABC-type transporter Mla MlaB component
MAEVRATAPGQLVLSGDLLFGDAVAVAEAGRRLLAGAGDGVTVDLSGLERVNSAVLAVLLDWQRAAAAGNRRLRITGTPGRVAGLVRLSDLGELLGQE